MASIPVLLTSRYRISLEFEHDTKKVEPPKPQSRTRTILSTVKDSKLTRKEIKRGLQIFRRHAIDKHELPQSLPRIQIDEYFEIVTCITQAEIDQLMKKERKWVVKYGDEKMKVDSPAMGEKAGKGEGGGRKEKFAKSYVKARRR